MPLLLHAERGNARKVMPNAFTKHAAARALVRAKTANAMIRSTVRGRGLRERWIGRRLGKA